MKLIITVVAGALMGVSAVAGKPEAELSVTAPAATVSGMGSVVPPDVAGLRPAVDALRSGDATYVNVVRVRDADYVPPRPPL